MIVSEIAALVGAAVVSVDRLAGGHICDAYRVTTSDGALFAKTLDSAPADMFAVEAAGLRWLDDAGGPVPGVVAVDTRFLVLEWVTPGPPTADAAARFGAALAGVHRSGAATFGGPQAGWIGPLPLDNTPTETWPAFYAERRLEPYLRRAVDQGAVNDADRATVETVIGFLDQLAGPTEPPSRIHGDLWSGNLLWGADGVVRLVDPAAHGGSRETDLAMLALFGCPHIETIVRAYEQTYPLADGWRERTALHQLHPLLVHAALFGGGYGARAGAAARTAMGAAGR